jgi:hypothetical protein
MRIYVTSCCLLPVSWHPSECHHISHIVFPYVSAFPSQTDQTDSQGHAFKIKKPMKAKVFAPGRTLYPARWGKLFTAHISGRESGVVGEVFERTCCYALVQPCACLCMRVFMHSLIYEIYMYQDMAWTARRRVVRRLIICASVCVCACA